MVYPVDSLGAFNDSAFWAAYNTPNPLSFRGSASPSKQQSVQDSAPVIVEEKNGGRAGWVLGSLVTAGIVALGVAGYIKGDKNAKVVQRTWDGVKTIFRSTKNKFVQEHPTVSKEGDKVVMRFAGEKNRMSGTKALAELGNIGESYTPNKLSELAEPAVEGGVTCKLKPGNDLRAFEFTHKVEEGGKQYWVGASGKNSGVCRIYEIGEKGTKVDVTKTLEKDNPDVFRTIQGKVRSYRVGEGDLTELDKAYVRTIDPNTGLLTQVQYSRPVDGGTLLDTNGKLLHATSDKFALGSDKVDAYLADHEGAQKVIDAIKEGKTTDLKVAFAERVVPEIGTFKLDKNGNIEEIIENGSTKPTKPGSDRFKALMQRAKDTEYSFDKISSDRTKWTKTRYYAK